MYDTRWVVDLLNVSFKEIKVVLITWSAIFCNLSFCGSDAKIWALLLWMSITHVLWYWSFGNMRGFSWKEILACEGEQRKKKLIGSCFLLIVCEFVWVGFWGFGSELCCRAFSINHNLGRGLSLSLSSYCCECNILKL